MSSSSETGQSPESGGMPQIPEEERRRRLPPEAQRALAEADARRAEEEARAGAHPRPREINGQAGPEPTRYGDWEKKGILSDF